ncbi:orotidine-5'-phosphate decarboxylase [Scrofimicrobium sp. R131]|uniref:Orotidine 5'-phosphate decarboxylase n=1 Tax=Scrofimicrobium appendicitidis TaxID=3079930 RepID=A0AAU7V6U5_9ACTO
MTERAVIVAADFPTATDLADFLARLPGEKPFLKVGMELFYGAGPDLVRQLKQDGYRIFLDLKLHDIPNTVKSAMRVLRDLEVDLVNLHASGGKDMMEAALEGLTRPDGSRPMLIAVTQLTSTSQDMLEYELLIPHPVEEVVAAYAQTAAEAGLDGVVCSPREVGVVKALCGPEFLTVTPGVRFADDEVGDQVRIATPAQARLDGADFIVMGRPITRAHDPLAAYRRARADFEGVTL